MCVEGEQFHPHRCRAYDLIQVMYNAMCVEVEQCHSRQCHALFCPGDDAMCGEQGCASTACKQKGGPNFGTVRYGAVRSATV